MTDITNITDNKKQRIAETDSCGKSFMMECCHNHQIIDIEAENRINDMSNTVEGGACGMHAICSSTWTRYRTEVRQYCPLIGLHSMLGEVMLVAPSQD